jgi:hypothetical protein
VVLVAFNLLPPALPCPHPPRWKWKTAVGPPEARPGHPNANWGYWSTDALGPFEFMLLCEELGAEPVWVVNAGISQSESVQPRDLAGWVQVGLEQWFRRGNPPIRL